MASLGRRGALSAALLAPAAALAEDAPKKKKERPSPWSRKDVESPGLSGDGCLVKLNAGDNLVESSGELYINYHYYYFYCIIIIYGLGFLIWTLMFGTPLSLLSP